MKITYQHVVAVIALTAVAIVGYGAVIQTSPPLVAGPTIGASPNPAQPFTPVSVTGSAFGATEPISIYLDTLVSKPLATTMTDATGSFATSATLKQTYGGLHSVIAQGQTSGVTATAPLSVSAIELLAPSSGQLGATVEVTDSGFAASEAVNAYWEPGHTLLASKTTGPLGSLTHPNTMTFTVPSSTLGGYTVSSIGQTSGITATAPFTIAGPAPTNTPTSTPTSTPTDTPTSAPTPTKTNTPRPNATNTPTPTITPTPTRTNTPLPPTPTDTATPTDTPTSTFAPTLTPRPTATPTRTPLPTATPTPAPCGTAAHSGVTGSSGNYTFSLLHTDASGTLRDANNCHVVLTGMNLQTDLGNGGLGGASSPSQLATDIAAFETKMHLNVWRVYINNRWWQSNVAEISPINGGCSGCSTYQGYIKWLIATINGDGAYALATFDTQFHETPPNDPCQVQGETDYTGTLIDGCTTINTAYKGDRTQCKDGSVLTYSLPTQVNIATTYKGNPGVMMETWNEMGEVSSIECGFAMGGDADTSANGYSDYRTLGGPSPAYHQPYWGLGNTFGAWFDHNLLAVDAMRQNGMTQAIMTTGSGAAAYFCPLNGDSSTSTASCNGSPTLPSFESQDPTHATNLMDDYHMYPDSFFGPAAASWPTKADFEWASDHNRGEYPVLGEYGGKNPPAGYYAPLFTEAKKDDVGMIYYEPANLANMNSNPVAFNSCGNAVASDLAYLRNDAGAVSTPIDSTGSCP